MKYFTPQLFVKMQSISNEQEFLATNQAWEKAVERYRTQVEALTLKLPRPLRRLVRDLHLHDANIVAMDQGPRTLTITLQLDPPAPFLTVLSYSLLGKPEIDREALPPEFRSSHCKWLYDELDTTPPAGSRRPVSYCHDILLSNGWEMKVRFRKLLVSQREALLPLPPSHAGAIPSALSQTA